jgi:hypothetical protein
VKALGLLTVLTPIILAGCGGSGTSKLQSVKGDGYTFTAPAGWKTVRQPSSVTLSNGKVDLLQVTHFPLEKPYRIARFAAVSRELDGVADGLAKQDAGRVVKRLTMLVSGRKTRYYEIHYTAKKTTEEIAFVLSGSDEYQVLCRRPAAAADSTCSSLFASFGLSSV